MLNTIIKRIRAHHNRVKADELNHRAAEYSRLAEMKLGQAMRYADSAPSIARMYGDDSAGYSRLAGRLRTAARIFARRADQLSPEASA